MQPVASTPAAYLKGKTMREYAIVTAGGKIDDDFALRILSENEAAFLVVADRGLVFLDRHGIVPDLVVGDFDSAGEEYVRQYLQTHPELMMIPGVAIFIVVLAFNLLGEGIQDGLSAD